MVLGIKKHIYSLFIFYLDKFPQLKYIFKKNKDGNYYVSDIINLNYEEDFEKCD